MTFKEFNDWCNKRTSDGCWDYLTALVCIDIIDTINKLPLLKRNKAWKEKEQQVIDEIINPINALIEKRRKNV